MAGEKTLGELHWKMTEFAPEDLFGVRENSIRHEVDAVAMKAGLKFLVNVVMNDREELVGVFSGDPVEAHRRGAKMAEAVYGVTIRKKPI